MTLKEWVLEIPAVRDEAKVLFGVSCIHSGGNHYPDGCVPQYIYHLEQLLKSDDPEKYLKENTEQLKN